MIIEGLVTTTDAAGGMHVAAMGPWVDEGERDAGPITRLVLRPFASSQTGANLRLRPEGVFHITDDVLLLAGIVAGGLESPPPAHGAPGGHRWLLDDFCRAWEFVVESVDASEDRLRLDVRVVAEHAGRPFLGFNRAAHAVVEAAILITRRHLLGADEVRRRLGELSVLVEKTGGERERRAFSLLEARAAGG